MRRLPLLLATLVLGAQAPAQEGDEAEAIKDPKSGLVVQLPDGWSRESGREKGNIRFAGMYDLTPQRYVLFEIETGPATGFDEAQWLQTEKAAVSKYLKTQDTPWSTEPIMVGGARAGRFTVGGKANAEKEFELRIRRCGLVRNDVFFQITEYSYSKAHEEAADPVKAMWEAIKFEEPNPFGDDEKKEEDGEESSGMEEGGGGGAETPKGEPLVIEDKAGNFKVSLPAGWSLDRAPTEDEDDTLRLLVHRAEGSADVAWLEIQRVRILRSDFFEQNEAGDAVEKLNEEIKGFERFFEEGSSKVIRPTIDARAQLGKVDKACGYEVKGLPLSEEAKITEAQKLIARGDTSVTVPEFKELVVRGRVAMISPYIYVTFAWTMRGQHDDERLVAEIAQIHDSLEFGTTEGKPPPLETGEGPFGNTLADPKNATERKVSKSHPYKKGAKVAAELKFDYVLPPGFQDAERVQGAVLGGDLALQIVAQDENNGWVWIQVIAQSAKSLPSNTSFIEKKKVFETWISNFESQARGTGRLPKKPEKVKFGSTLDGDGCVLEGKINGFHATEFNLVTDDGGWRIQLEMKTRGSGARTFAKQIEIFKKKFKVRT